MWLIDWCKHLKLPYLYLGYWIKNSRKMAYKENFAPQEALIDGEWQKIKHAKPLKGHKSDKPSLSMLQFPH